MKARFLVLLVLALLVGGCASQIRTLDLMWERENQQLYEKLGTRDYQGVSKEQAMNALAITFKRLDLIMSNSDYRAGTLTASAKAPKPLSYAEFKVVEEVEGPRSSSVVWFMTWGAFSSFDSILNAVVLETEGGVQVSVRGKLQFTGSTLEMIPVTQFPPKALEIGLRKLWDEYDKNIFVQKKTLAY